jgi:hypothetical protein
MTLRGLIQAVEAVDDAVLQSTMDGLRAHAERQGYRLIVRPDPKRRMAAILRALEGEP